MHKQFWKSCITSILLFLTGCTDTMSKNDTKFEWYATECAPKHYPIKIIQGTFLYHGEKDNGLYVPSGGILHDGWGDSVSTHSAGDDLKPLPDRLSIVYFSYAEKQFYKGDFDLPYEKILALFREGVAASKEKPYYRRVMVGVAPGGDVAVWLTGFRTKEVFFGKAQKIDLKYGRALGLPFDNQQEEDAFVDGLLVDSLKPDELESLKKDGIPFGLWSRYRNLYRWELVFTKGIILARNELPVHYLNGELDYITVPQTNNTIMTSRPLPIKLSYKTIVGNTGRNDIIYFDEFELMDTFEKLGTNGELVRIEFEPGLTRPQTRVRVYNEKESVVLKNAVISER